MKKYMFIFWAPRDQESPEPSPEELQALFAQWEAWKAKFKDQVVDMGDALQPTGHVLKGGEVTDGPHAEAKEIVAGYSIIQAETPERALVVARECPWAFAPGAAIEIREAMG